MKLNLPTSIPPVCQSMYGLANPPLLLNYPISSHPPFPGAHPFPPSTPSFSSFHHPFISHPCHLPSPVSSHSHSYPLPPTNPPSGSAVHSRSPDQIAHLYPFISISPPVSATISIHLQISLLVCIYLSLANSSPTPALPFPFINVC